MRSLLVAQRKVNRRGAALFGGASVLNAGLEVAMEDELQELKNKLKQATTRLTTSLMPWWIAGELTQHENQEQPRGSCPPADSDFQL